MTIITIIIANFVIVIIIIIIIIKSIKRCFWAEVSIFTILQLILRNMDMSLLNIYMQNMTARSFSKKFLEHGSFLYFSTRIFKSLNIFPQEKILKRKFKINQEDHLPKMATVGCMPQLNQNDNNNMKNK